MRTGLATLGVSCSGHLKRAHCVLSSKGFSHLQMGKLRLRAGQRQNQRSDSTFSSLPAASSFTKRFLSIDRVPGQVLPDHGGAPYSHQDSGGWQSSWDPTSLNLSASHCYSDADCRSSSHVCPVPRVLQPPSAALLIWDEWTEGWRVG